MNKEITNSMKEKGDLLENITAEFCKGIDNAKITEKAKIIGRKTDAQREIDVLIEGKYGLFDVKIAIESKNYKKPVGVEKVESFKTKLEDVGINLGVMVCPLGFTKVATKEAQFNGIMLFEAYDQRLGNVNLFIPLRYIVPRIKDFSFRFGHRAEGPFTIPQNKFRWRFHIDNMILNAEQIVLYAWNKEMIPQKAGEHIVNFNTITMSDTWRPDSIQYCELVINVRVIEKYYLKLFPASFLKNIKTGHEKFNLKIDAYSKETDMLKNGWKKFSTFEELNKAADIENQPKGIRDLIVREQYNLDIDKFAQLKKDKK